MFQKIRKLLADKGQGVVEYALLLGFVAVITVAMVSGDDDSLKNIFTKTLKGVMSQFTKFNSAPDKENTYLDSGNDWDS